MDDERLRRLETRLVQLMIWLGADPHGPNAHSGFVTKLKEDDRGEDGNNSGGASVVPDWNKFNRPAYLRRGGECAERPGSTSAPQEGDATKLAG